MSDHVLSSKGNTVYTFRSCVMGRLSSIAIAFVLAMATVLVVAPFAHADASQGSVKRVIDIVYDDSGSMDNSSSWAQAHYALEALVGMMGPGDELNVFPMSAGDSSAPAVTVYGTSQDVQQSVDRIHQVFSDHPSNTTFSPAQQAYAHLSSIGGDDSVRRYLVVLTDGGFTSVDSLTRKKDGADAIVERVNGYLYQWASESDVEIIYVGMGEKGLSFPMEQPGLQVSKTADRGILYGIVDVCNDIYGLSSLPDTHFVNESLKLPIPTKRIIVFAQGRDVSVDYAEIEGDRLSPTTVNLAAADAPHLNGNEKWVKKGSPTDESLRGIVATFEPVGAEGFNSGEMVLSMANAENVEIYYEPYVNVEMTLVDAGVSDSELPWPLNQLLATGDTVIDSSNTDVRLTKGTYYVSSRLMNPLTGEAISPSASEGLISSVDMKASLDYSDGRQVSLDEKKVVLEEGEGVLSTHAVVCATPNDPDPTVVDQEMDVVVDPANIFTLILRFGLLLLVIALILALIWAIRKHLKAPRLPKDLNPQLKDKFNPAANRTLQVESQPKNTPFFGAETQEFYMRMPRNYDSRVMPRSVRLRAVKGGMVIDNWSELVAAAQRDNVASGAIKVGAKDLRKVKQGEECPVLGSSGQITFVARRGGTETKMQLKFK